MSVKSPRRAETYRAERRNGRRKLGGLSRKTPRKLLPAVPPNTKQWMPVTRKAREELAALRN